MPKETRIGMNPKSRVSFVPGPRERGQRLRQNQQSETSLVGPSTSTASTTGTVRAGPSQGSFFESSNNVQNFGGQFSSSQGHHTNLTINFHQYANEERSQIVPHQNTAVDSSVEVQDSSLGDQPHASELPSRKSSEIYYRYLATKKRGSPLWIPEPNNMLPVEYQKRGLGIGDVGIITDYGAFDYLFNICAPQTDQINPEDMPEDFSPLNPPLRYGDVHGYSASKADSHLASAQVETFQQDNDSLGLTFESSASEGAILTMPCGSNSKDLRNLFKFRKYALANAEKWYKYANETRSREARNGDLRLVVGYDSTTTWGMATFANLSEHRYSRLRFKPIGENSLGRIYGWEYSGISMAEVRSGPDIHELEKLRTLDRAEDDVWNRLAEEWEMPYIGDESQMPYQDFDLSSATGKFPSSDTGPDWSGSGDTPDTSMQEDQDARTSFNESLQLHATYISHMPPALDIHPSRMINAFLLKKRPNAKVAITEDKDWMSVLEMDDEVLPSPEIILDRIKMMYDICEEEGMGFLQLKTLMQTENNESTRIDYDVQLKFSSPWIEVRERYANLFSNHTPAASADRHCSLLTPASAPGTSPLSVLNPVNRFSDSSSEETNHTSGLIISAPDAMRLFRRSLNWLPSKLKKSGNHQIFKLGIPIWQYSMNDQGGKWNLTLRTNPTRRSEQPNLLALVITGEEMHGGRSGLDQPMKKQRASKEKLVRVTSVGAIVVQDGVVYKLPWGSW